MRRVPVDSSRTNVERKRPRPSSSSSSSTRAATLRSASYAFGRCSAAETGSRCVDPALAGDGDGLGDGERREQPGVLERPAEAARGAAGRASAR